LARTGVILATALLHLGCTAGTTDPAIAAAARTRSAETVDVLVQGAMDEELGPLLKALQDRREERIDAWTFWSGWIGAKRVVVSRTDVGPLNAAASTALGIERFRPKIVINQGTAGGHNRAVDLWDIVVGEWTVDLGAFNAEHGDTGSGQQPARWHPRPHELRDHTGDEVEHYKFPGDPGLVAAALDVPYDRGHLHRGTIGSAFQFNRELDRIDWLHQTYGSDTEDMESAFAAGVAVAMGTPFLAVRIVSNHEWGHPTFEQIAGQYCAEFVLDLIGRFP